MFIRVKSTPNSPRKSVQICEGVRKNNKVQQHVVRHVGVAKDDAHLIELKKLASVIKRQLIEDRQGPSLFPLETLETEVIPPMDTQTIETPKTSCKKSDFSLPVDLQQLREKHRIVEGFHDVFGKLFREIGFHILLTKKQTEVLQDVLLARIAAPSSKLHTQSILAADFGKDISLDRIYRMMDALIEHKELIQGRIFCATQQLCFAEATIVLFDVTTLYFESIETDALRNFGFSKDQQFHTTQVVLALATTSEGLPVGYRLFPGDTAEISTLLACLDEWKRTLKIGKVVFVGDRGMMSEKNLQALEEAGVIYIVGAKLKKLSQSLQEQILQGPRQTEENDVLAIQEFNINNNRRLVISHSAARAVKDKKDRERGISKIQKRIGKGKNLKKLIPNYGYQKFIKAEGEGKLVVDEEKIVHEERWDGFHGLVTNSHDLNVLELLAHYRRLWVIEESFRIHKHNLSIRPIYHFKAERIESHVLLCYMAFAMIRHFEFRLEKQQTRVTLDEMKTYLWKVQSSVLKDEENGSWYRIPSPMSNQAKKIYQVFGLTRSLQPHELVQPVVP